MNILKIVELYGTQFAALGAAAAFIFGIYKFQSERTTVKYWKEFDAYHNLLKSLLQETDGHLIVERQAAVVYELRFYKRYYPYSLRLLKYMQERKWEKVREKWPVLPMEADLTIRYIEKRLTNKK